MDSRGKKPTETIDFLTLPKPGVANLQDVCHKWHMQPFCLVFSRSGREQGEHQQIGVGAENRAIYQAGSITTGREHSKGPGRGRGFEWHLGRGLGLPFCIPARKGWLPWT